jgi:predicted DNA-binding ribbon-helix-helix protein
LSSTNLDIYSYQFGKLGLDISFDSVYNEGMERKYTLERLDKPVLYSFKIDQSLLDWLRQEAKNRKISVSQLIREAVEFYMRFTKAA